MTRLSSIYLFSWQKKLFKIANDWILTVGLRCQKQPHCHILNLSIAELANVLICYNNTNIFLVSLGKLFKLKLLCYEILFKNQAN